MTLLAWEMAAIFQWFKHSLVLPFLGIEMRIDPGLISSLVATAGFSRYDNILSAAL